MRELIESEARHAEAMEAVADEGEPIPAHVKVTRGRGRSRVLQVRLNDDELQQLEKLAAGRYIPVSTLARAMLLRAMEAEARQT